MPKANNKSSEELQYVPYDDPLLVWTTFDLGCCAALLCAGYQLLDMDRGHSKKVLFVLERADGIENAVDRYWSDRLEVRAREYFDTIKMLKNRLYSE